jgi:hypothetical protein
MPACYVSPELLALVEIEAEQFGGVSQATRALWSNYLRSKGHTLPKDVDKAEQYQRRVAQLKAEIHPRQPRAESKPVVWE